MKYIIICLIQLLGLFSKAQDATLKFQNEKGEGISFLYLFDSEKNLRAITNENGVIQISDGNYKFETSHVSYLNKTISISSSQKDTIIVIQLLDRVTKTEEVIVKTSLQNQKWRKNEIGTFHNSGKSSSGVYHNLKTGIVFAFTEKDFNTAILESIKFKTDINKKLKITDTLLIEIKLYGIYNGLVEANPLNKIPIYLNIKELRKKNEIKVNEKILIPKEGLFLSFEVPFSTNKTKPILVFFGNFNNTECKFFVRNTKELNWPTNIITQGCKSHSASGNSFYPFISLKYKYN